MRCVNNKKIHDMISLEIRDWRVQKIVSRDSLLEFRHLRFDFDNFELDGERHTRSN